MILNNSSQEIIQAIDQTYNKVQISNSDNWNHRGRSSYNFFHVHEFKLIGKLIQSCNQNEFIIMDIGAGNCKWGRACSNYINNLKFNIKVKIFSLTGGNEDNIISSSQSGTCTIYEYDKFKIECLSDELEKHGHYLNNKVDLCVSSFTFMD